MECRELTNDRLLEATPEVRDHVAACAGCRDRAAELRALEAELAALGRALPSDHNPALVQRILARMQKRKYVVRRASPWKWAAGIAAAAGLILAVFFATREAPRPTDPVVVTPPEKPRLETILDPVPPPPVPERPRDLVPHLPPPEPPPVPAPRPQPRPPVPEPERPAPPPVPAPTPTPAPRETKPARVFLTLAQVEGALELEDKRVEKGAEWDAGAALRSGDRLARFTLPDGTRVTLRPRTELLASAAEPPTLQLERGEVFCEVRPGAGRRFAIVTADGRVDVTGTQFGVKRNGHTEITVAAGEVVVSNEKGESRVPAGMGLAARKAAAPGKPRIVDPDLASAWRRAMDPPEKPRFRYDFEDHRLPYPWTGGKVAAGPARGLNRACLEGSPGIDADLSRVDKRVTAVTGTLKVRFRYYATSGDQLWVQLNSERVRDNFRFDVKQLVHHKWETLEMPLAEFYRMVDGSRVQEGDRFLWLNISVSNAAGPVWFDDIELVEVLK